MRVSVTLRASSVGPVRSRPLCHLGRRSPRFDRRMSSTGSTEAATRARFEDRELLRQFQEVERLPDEDKTVVKKLLDAFLTKKQIQRLAAQ